MAIISVKAVFLLPMKDNDGTDLTDLIDDFEQRLALELESGWSQFVGLFRGGFKMSDRSHKVDMSQMYHVIFTNESEKKLEEELKKLKDMLIEFKSKTTQQSIYFEINKNVEFLLL